MLVSPTQKEPRLGRQANMIPQTGRTEHAVASVERDLKVLGQARRYYDWILAILRPWIGHTVLECGAGSGHMTRRLLALNGPRVIASEVEASYLPELEVLCRPPQSGVVRLDLEALTPHALELIRSLDVDTILMVNVLEHVADDAASITRLAEVLPSGGRILIMVPAHRRLYSQLDHLYGHHRRYSRADVRHLATMAGMRIRLLQSMNLPGAIAWWLLHRVIGRTSLTPAGTRMFDLCVPIIAAVERRMRPPFGQSLVAVLERS